MSSTELLTKLKTIQLSNPTALRLRSHFVALLENEQPLPLSGQRLNLSAAAQSIGKTRQIFYKDRGSPEIAELRVIIEQSAISELSSNKRNRAPDNSLDETMNKLFFENSELRQQLKRSKTLEIMLERGTPILL